MAVLERKNEGEKMSEEMEEIGYMTEDMLGEIVSPSGRGTGRISYTAWEPISSQKYDRDLTEQELEDMKEAREAELADRHAQRISDLKWEAGEARLKEARKTYNSPQLEWGEFTGRVLTWLDNTNEEDIVEKIYSAEGVKWDLIRDFSDVRREIKKGNNSHFGDKTRQKRKQKFVINYLTIYLSIIHDRLYPMHEFSEDEWDPRNHDTRLKARKLVYGDD